MEAAWGERIGRTVRIADMHAVGGGCVSPVARVESEAGDVAFVKWRPQTRGMFEAEADGLAALRSAGALRVPEVLAVAGDGEWLLMEWLEPGAATARTWERLGRGLATLHGPQDAPFGWERDNFIGPVPQSNGVLSDWAEFWRARRLEPQLARAVDAGSLDGRTASRTGRLIAALPDVLAGAAGEAPALLHGDLWSGNLHVTAGGEPALVDPSVYRGHREVDLAMAELFGGFDRRFFDAYHEVLPIPGEYRRVRRHAYQLYYLLVHVDLFGGSYVPGVRSALEGVGY